jgi:rSAM/selenodomain-associated transferase 2
VKPAITIIIPTLNDAHYLERLLDRILTNAGPSIEVIVCDGGSQDEAKKICQDKKVHFIQTKPSRAIQMNAGAKLAKADYLYFLHADTIPRSSFLEDLKQLIADDKPAACYRSKFDKGPFMLKLNAKFTRLKWLVARGGDQSLLIKKPLFEELGGYDEGMHIMEEFPLIKKLLSKDLLTILPHTILICTRKYENRSWLKVSRANTVAFRMFKKGTDSAAIKARYESLLG